MKHGFRSGKPLGLVTLNDFMLLNAWPDDCTKLSYLDGFLTGLAVGPELIPLTERCPVIWGGNPPQFEKDEMAELIISAIMERDAKITRSLSSEPPHIEPIFWKTDEGMVIAGDWASGFMEAMSLRPQAWTEMLDDDDAGLPLVPIIALVRDKENDPIPISGSDSHKWRLGEIADLIPICVLEIRAFWKTRRGLVSELEETPH